MKQYETHSVNINVLGPFSSELGILRYVMDAIHPLCCGYDLDSWLMGHVMCFLCWLSKTVENASFKRVLLC